MQKSLFYILFLVLCLSGLKGEAQDEPYTPPVLNPLGKFVGVDKYARIKGSPYLYDDWMHGEVVTTDGKVYKKMLIKYNTDTDVLTFVYDKKDEPQKFAEPVRMFTLYADRERVFANQFPKIDQQKTTTYYEVLQPGNAMLLKRQKAVLEPSRNDLNRAFVDEAYANRNAYYIYKDKKIYRLKANRNAVLSLLSDKASEVSAYAENQNMKFDREEDLKKLVNYYNTL